MRITEDCIGCGSCPELCPVGAIHYLPAGRYRSVLFIDPDLCTNCEKCLAADCPGNAIRRDGL